MDERELVGLLYRADWTRLPLTGLVRGAAGSVLSVFGLDEAWEADRPGVAPRPPLLTPDMFEGATALDLAPGQRFRLTSADGRWLGGSDGARTWQLLPDLPRGVRVSFTARPQPPVEPLLAPSWLLTGHTLTVREPTTVCGRPGVQFSAVRAEAGRPLGLAGPGELSPTLRWDLPGQYDRVVAVIDATLGFLLRCEFQFADGAAAVTEFVSLTVGAEVDASVFTAPPGSLSGDGPDPDDSVAGILGKSGREAATTIAGLAAGALGAVIRYAPARRADPFAAATAEVPDPDRDMPADAPLPGWVTDGTEPGGAVPAAGAGGMRDDLLHLLYRGGVAMTPFTATLHEWIDGSAIIEAAVPPAARQVGFGGVGYLFDVIRRQPEAADGRSMHQVHKIRFGGWDRYRVDRLSPSPGARPGRPDSAWTTIACDGSRCWQVYPDRVETWSVRAWPAILPPDPAGGLADGSWLLRGLLAGGEEVVADGRPGYRVIVTARPGAAPLGLFGWLTGAGLPAVAVVDAATGRLLRLTRYLGGQPARRMEFRSLADGGPDDFGFTPPAGLRVVDRTVSSPRPDSSGGPDSWPPAEEIDLGDAARGAADAVRRQVDEKVAAARGFLGTFLGGGRPS